MPKRVAIIIPIYKAQPTDNEIKSLRQACSVLRSYPIIFVCHQSLNTDRYTSVCKESGVKASFEFFDKCFFESVAGYNKLMLNKLFYERFLQYKYILIFQLDCYIFRDELKQWVAKNYDYIGAPWTFNDKREWTFYKRAKFKVKRSLKRLRNAPNSMYTTYYKVGNGGLSLRRTDKFHQVCLKFHNSKRFEQYKTELEDSPLYNEDVFWSVEVNRYYPHLRIPSYQKALQFSFDVDPKLCYSLNNEQLPMGCHAWERYDADFWEPFIKE